MRFEEHLARIAAPFDRPWQWIAVSAVILGIDQATGTRTNFFLALVFPVAAAAWHRGLPAALMFALGLPLVKLSFALFFEHPSPPILEPALNAVVRALSLVTISFLVDTVHRQLVELDREVRTLSGLLPICMYCKMIRDGTGAWLRLEAYISGHSEAEFSHGLCPKCEVTHLHEVEHD